MVLYEDMKTCLGGDHWRTPGIQKHSPWRDPRGVLGFQGPHLQLRACENDPHTLSVPLSSGVRPHWAADEIRARAQPRVGVQAAGLEPVELAGCAERPGLAFCPPRPIPYSRDSTAGGGDGRACTL